MLNFWGVRYIVELMMTKTIGFYGSFQLTKPSNLDLWRSWQNEHFEPKVMGVEIN